MKFQFGELRKSGFVCEKPVNKRMLICIACGNGSIEYRIELSKTRRQKSSSNLYFFLLGYISVRNEI